MTGEIVAIGTELLLGQNVDTNSAWLARQLAELGLDVHHLQAVGDNERRLEEILKLACSRSDVVVATGGLGPTVDDVTRKAAARLAKKQLVFQDDLAKRIEEKFTAKGIPCPKTNLNQAFIPQGAMVVQNPVGTAPGFIVKVGNTQLACLPGVPSEMKAMFEATVRPHLRATAPTGAVIKSRVYRTTGIPESALNERILDLFENSKNPTVAVLAHTEGVDVRLTAKAPEEGEAERLLDGLGKTLLARLPNVTYGTDQDGLEVIVGRLLTTHRLTVATAESCTGGLLGHRITQVPGSTQYYLGGWTTYSNRLKSASLGVDPKLIEKHGAVSPQVAEAMARNAREKSGADLGISATGVAGPTGGSAEKPVGLVHLGLADDQGVQTFEFRFTGDRSAVKMKTSQAALDLLRRHCLQLPLRE